MTETRKLSAIMFSDIQGYSRLMQKDEALTLKLLEEHNALLFPIIEAHSGKIIKTVGDAILSVFDSCISAIQSAIEIQNALEIKANHEKEKKYLRVRIGVHLGETVYKNNDIFGNGVNIAARLQPLADPGGICFSQAVYEQLQNHYSEKIVRVGPVNLKNISDPIVIYRMQIEGEVESHPSSIPMDTAYIETHSLSKKPQGPDHEKIEVLFGSFQRNGVWEVKKSMFIKNAFGAILIDFTQIKVTHPVIEIEILNYCGAVGIVVPENFNVDIHGKAILGVFDGKSNSGRTGPLLKITGKVVMGAVGIKTKQFS
ncbi:MAG: adenylate/guanylate cyclase domain-containing protein [Leptospiraceae bacterium]|nr:adenylate/guanylate cyclase domain-containing protein [Leptospiraceae bacterium]MCK6380665.1 adenylate/guanylate cyclase domain-containing protein [Leptospiraceae bacterium]NUM41957.1 adenylate/guanylate cyclase domain-containing protein [Leptospiraceae bacterium]